jgi:glycosyltransferase involved in cell wall biosynthesis
MYATVGPRCGIADYTRSLVAALAVRAHVTPIPLRPASLNPLSPVLAGLRLCRHDVAHVQHTYSFFGVDPLTYTLLVRVLFASIRAPLVLTAHTVREPGPARYNGGLGSRLANTVGAPAWHDLETFRRADLVIVHAGLHQERLVGRGLPRERCWVIPPGVPARMPVSASALAAFRGRYGLNGRLVVGVFGFLERSKRFAHLVEAVGAVSGPGAEGPILLVAGGPRLPAHEIVAAEIRQVAAHAGLMDRIVMTGYLEPVDVPVALEAMDVVVVPYATDQSVSYSLHLALAQRRPVVATDLPPLREIRERGQCLLLVRPDDPIALAETLRGLLRDRAARRVLTEAAAAYAETAGVAVAAARTLEAYAAAREVRGG